MPNDLLPDDFPLPDPTPDVASSSELVLWAEARLAEQGALQTGPAEAARIVPWSSVYRIPTADGPAWAKENWEGARYEARLVGLLARHAPRNVQHPLALEARRGWMLFADGGPTMDAFAPHSTAFESWIDALCEYAGVQRRMEAHVPAMLNGGVPDRRPERLPELFEAIVAARDALAVGEDGGLSEAEWSDLKGLVPRVHEWCGQLAGDGIPPTVQHDDLKEENVFVKDGYRLFDWGEAVVAHPFTSLLSALDMTERAFGLPPEDSGLRRVRDAYLSAWDLEPEFLVEQAEVALLTGILIRATALLHSPEGVRRTAHEWLRSWMRRLMNEAALKG